MAGDTRTGLDRVATLVSEIISRSIPSGRTRSHALCYDRHALIMQMSLGLARAVVNERCTCIHVPSSGETSGLRADYDTRPRYVHATSRRRRCRRRRREINFSSGQKSIFKLRKRNFRNVTAC